jgi:hypothetical protein
MHMHPQLQELFRTPNMQGFFGRARAPDEIGEFERVLGEKRFRFIVSAANYTVAALSITVLMPGKTQQLLTNGGDIDNRIKTLLDALRVPADASEIPRSDAFNYGTDGLCCLLENDDLVDRLAVRTYHDFDPIDGKSVRCLIEVETRVTQVSWKSLAFA